jgi:hypothetical protein
LAVALKAGFAPAATGDLLTAIVGASDILLGSSGFMGLLLIQGHGSAVGRSIHRYLQVNTGISRQFCAKPLGQCLGPQARDILLHIRIVAKNVRPLQGFSHANKGH